MTAPHLLFAPPAPAGCALHVPRKNKTRTRLLSKLYPEKKRKNKTNASRFTNLPFRRREATIIHKRTASDDGANLKPVRSKTSPEKTSSRGHDEGNGGDGDGDALPGLLPAVSTFLSRCGESDTATAAAEYSPTLEVTRRDR